MYSCLSFSQESAKKARLVLIGLLVSLPIVLFILRNYLFSSGFISNSESIGGHPFHLEHVSYLWDSLFQQGNRVEALPIWILFALLGARLSYFLVLMLMGTIMFYVAVRLTKGAVSGLNQYFVGFLATMLYMVNPVTAYEIFRIGFIWSMAWAPLLFYMAFTYFKESGSSKNIVKKAVFLATICVLMSLNILWILFSFGLVFFCFLANLQKPLKKYVVNSFKLATVTFTSYFLVSFWWVFPYLKQLSAGIPLPITYIVTWESVQMLSQNADILNVIRLMGNWLTPSQFIFQYPLSTIFTVVTLIIPIIVFSCFLLKKDRKTFSIGLLTILLLALGTALYYFDSFGKIYGWLLFNFPVWFPRTASRWMMLLILCYVLLLSIFSAASLSRIGKIRRSARFRKTASVLFFIGLLTPITIVGLPLTLNAPMTSAPLPDDYTAINQWLEDMEGDFKVLAIPDMPFWGYPKPTITWSWLAEMVQENKSVQLNKFLEFRNVKYVLVDGNMLTTQELGELISILENQENLEFCKEIGNIHIFESNSYCSIISVFENNVLVQGSLAKIISLTALDAFNTKTTSILFLDQDTSFEKLSYSDILLLESESINYRLLSTDKQALYIEPFTATKNHDPSHVWSKAGTDDPLHGPWHSYLESRDIDNWDFDYGEGLVFTWAPSKLENPAPTTDDLINQWTFDLTDDVSQWQNYTLETQGDALQLVSSDNGALKAELWNSTSDWKTINSPLISAEYSNWYRWELQVKGENAKSVHIKIAEYDQEQKIIGAYRVAGLDSGNFDWQTTTIDYTPQNSETKYIQLQVWHGHETTQPLPNKIWVDNVKVYDLEKFVEPVSLDVPFVVSEGGEYVLLARFFRSEVGGEVQVQVGDVGYMVDTGGQLNEFTWEQLGTLDLQEGQHTVTLTNLEGFNAVNLFALVPKQEYEAAESELAAVLEGKSLVYVFEGESDFYSVGAEVSSKYGGEASNGKVIELTPESKVWRELEILKAGNYTLAIRSKGNFIVTIGEKTYLTNSTVLDWAYIGPITLETGMHEIEITYPTTYFAKWSFENGEPLEWTGTHPETQTLTIDENGYEERYALKAELTSSTWGWKTINSPLISVTPEITYGFDFHVFGENVQSVHVKIVEYDINEELLATKYIKSIGSGNFTWTKVNFDYTPSENVSYVQVQVWHGHETTQPLPNKIWIDDVKVYDYSFELSEMDLVLLYSVESPDETLEDVFTTEEFSAEVVSYQKVDPTRYVVTVDASEPFMLSFAEAYDSLWVARVNGEQIASVPLYSVVNGFWINQTGILEITIEYAPQEWFYHGSIISITTLIACLIYIVYGWMKDRAIWKQTNPLITRTRQRLHLNSKKKTMEQEKDSN